MKHLMSAVIAASVLIVPAVSFAAQADGPRAMERVVQQNDNYEKDHSQQPLTASNEGKAAPSSDADKSAYGSTSNGDSHDSGARRFAPAQSPSLFAHH
jgi:hypothetical protein